MIKFVSLILLQINFIESIPNESLIKIKPNQLLRYKDHCTLLLFKTLYESRHDKNITCIML